MDIQELNRYLNIVDKEQARLKNNKNARARKFFKYWNECTWYFEFCDFIIEKRGYDYLIKTAWDANCYYSIGWASDWIYDEKYTNKNIVLACLSALRVYILRLINKLKNKEA